MKIDQRKAIGVKLEAVQNTAVVPATATDYLWVKNSKTDLKPEALQRDYYRPSLDPLPIVIGKRMRTISFDIEFKGSGTRGDATPAGYPGLDALFQACKMTSTVSAGTSITYAPTSLPASTNFFSPGKSVTIEFYEDGYKKILSGCVGTWELKGEASKYPYLSFTMSGNYNEQTDVAVPSPTINNLNPSVLQSAPMTVQGLTAVWGSFTVKAGCTITERMDGGSPNSIKGFLITGWKPTLEIEIEAEAVATHNFENKLMAAASAATSIVIGATAGNILTLNFPQTQYTDIKEQAKNGLLMLSIPLNIAQNTGDDCMSIVIT